MLDPFRGLRALSHAGSHAIALWRVVRTFRNWIPLTTNYVWRRHPLTFSHAIFRSDGYRIHLNGQEDLGNLWAIFGRQEYPLTAQDTEIIDIGANIGLFTIFAAKKVKGSTITSFEPVGSTFESFCENLELSNTQKQVVPVNAGVAGSNGTRQIYLGTSSDLASMFARNASQGVEQIETKSINSILEERPSVSVLKMDCEGAEWEILDSADPNLFRRVRHLYIEFHGLTPEKIKTANNHLARLGFQQDRRQDHGAGETAVIWASQVV